MLGCVVVRGCLSPVVIGRIAASAGLMPWMARSLGLRAVVCSSSWVLRSLISARRNWWYRARLRRARRVVASWLFLIWLGRVAVRRSTGLSRFRLRYLSRIWLLVLTIGCC